ncbi:MAG: hypothetical protein MUO31_13060 [Thermodesulfovibrionales bacterium]|nr:hypothetical protein [Thermodesulfovibrionales bacterium]
MKPNIKTIPAVVILLAISALLYSVLFTANGNEPESITYDVNDPILLSWTGDASLSIDWTIERTDTITVNDTVIYTKNVPLLTKDELRDFALYISAMSALSSMSEEYYDGFLKLLPEKLLKDPND